MLVNGRPSLSGYVTRQEAAAQVEVSDKALLRRAKPLGAVPSRPLGDGFPSRPLGESSANSGRRLRRPTPDAGCPTVQAARIIGCGEGIVLAYVRSGAIGRRLRHRGEPS